MCVISILVTAVIWLTNNRHPKFHDLTVISLGILTTITIIFHSKLLKMPGVTNLNNDYFVSNIHHGSCLSQVCLANQSSAMGLLLLGCSRPPLRSPRRAMVHSYSTNPITGEKQGACSKWVIHPRGIQIPTQAENVPDNGTKIKWVQCGSVSIWKRL